MKTNKIFLTLALVVALSFSSFSQGGGIWAFQWAIGFPVGETNDFLDQTSFRGFGIDGRGYVTDRLTVGGRAAWQTFYKDYGFVTNENEQESYTISGNQRKYINAIPLTVNTHYYFGNGLALPYVGVGVGAYYIESRNYMGIYYVQEKAWHFGLAPEVGVVVPFGNSNTGINVALKYQYAAKTKDTQAVSWVELDIGIAYVF